MGLERWRLKGLSDVSSARQILAESGARYVVGDLASLAKLESDSTDVCFSMGRLEHSSTLVKSVLYHLMPLQRNKVRNLELGCARMDTLLLELGERKTDSGSC